jgi:acyl carrier protein
MKRFVTLPPGAYLPRVEIEERVAKVLQSIRGVDPQRITPEAHVYKDLGVDSVRRTELAPKLSAEFCIPFPATILTVEQIIKHISENPRAK